MSNSWYFSIHSNDNPNMVPYTMRILDEDMATNSEVNEIFYGFKRHGGGFGIEGFILFVDEKEESEVGGLIPGFTLMPFNYDIDADHFGSFVRRTSIFTKWGVARDGTITALETQWHYHELEEVHQYDQDVSFAQ